MKTIITGGRVIDPAQGLDGKRDVVIEKNKIEAITKPGQGKGKSRGKFKLIDAKGCIVAPGLVDMHVHLREPGYEGKETILSGSQAAVAGGFTSIVCMANTDPVNDNQVLNGFIMAKAKEAACRVFPVGAATVGLKGEQMANLGEMKESGVVAYSDDGNTVMNAEIQRRIFEMAAQYDMPVLVHAEDANLKGDGSMHEGHTSTELGLDGIPAAAEDAMVARDIILSRLTGCRLHIMHVSSGLALEIIRFAKRKKVKVTCEITPHHFTLAHEDIGDYDTNCKMSPPLRSERDRTALIKGIADGAIDSIATDHAPQGILLKQTEFDNAANGVIGLETALGLSLLLVQKKSVPLMRILEMLTIRPAQILRLDVGTLRPGKKADLCIFDPNDTFVYTQDRIRSKSKNSPFIGWELPGPVRYTIVDGKVVYKG